MRWRKLDRRACTTLLLARRSHVLGEVMLLASRLERECHVYGVPILMGEGTAPVSSDRYPRVAPDFSWRTGRSGLRRGMGAEDLHDGTKCPRCEMGQTPGATFAQSEPPFVGQLAQGLLSGGGEDGVDSEG